MVLPHCEDILPGCWGICKECSGWEETLICYLKQGSSPSQARLRPQTCAQVHWEGHPQETFPFANTEGLSRPESGAFFIPNTERTESPRLLLCASVLYSIPGRSPLPVPALPLTSGVTLFKSHCISGILHCLIARSDEDSLFHWPLSWFVASLGRYQTVQVS